MTCRTSASLFAALNAATLSTGERRVVEDRREEIVEAAAERDHRLTNVDQLRRAAADAVAAEQAPIFAVEQHLEHALIVAADRAARDFFVSRDPAS